MRSEHLEYDFVEPCIAVGQKLKERLHGHRRASFYQQLIILNSLYCTRSCQCNRVLVMYPNRTWKYADRYCSRRKQYLSKNYRRLGNKENINIMSIITHFVSKNTQSYDLFKLKVNTFTMKLCGLLLKIGKSRTPGNIENL